MIKTFYILDNNFNVVETEDINLWVEEMDHLKRMVAEHYIDGFRVSTVFLGTAHGFLGRPAFFETMVFDQNIEVVFSDRYTTWDEATAGHNRIVEYIRTGGEETDANMDNK